MSSEMSDPILSSALNKIAKNMRKTFKLNKPVSCSLSFELRPSLLFDCVLVCVCVWACVDLSNNLQNRTQHGALILF